MNKTLIVITGPTAVGKTALCLEIAKHFDIPIINADSRQIYRELRIGTAQPTKEQMQEVKHYLFFQTYFRKKLPRCAESFLTVM